MIIGLFCISYFARRATEAPTREQLYSFSEWDSVFPNHDALIQLIQDHLQLETTWNSIERILSRRSRRCILFVYLDFIDSEVDSWLLDWFPHLQDYSGGRFNCTLTRHVDREDNGLFELFDHCDHINKRKLVQGIKSRWFYFFFLDQSPSELLLFGWKYQNQRRSCNFKLAIFWRV